LKGGRSEQKVTTLDKELAGTFLPSMVPFHPGVLEKKFVLNISHRVANVKLCPPLVAILDFQSIQKVTTLG
jgi:hypothetical protein